MDNRASFVGLALAEGANVSALRWQFGISRKTGHKWLARVRAGGDVADRPRRPLRSPRQTQAAVEARVVALRAEHPTWGGRKLRRRLQTLEASLDGAALSDASASDAALGGLVAQAPRLPSPSTITAILDRHGLIDPEEAQKRVPFVRFEHERANALWQMDFKGHFACGAGRCHPLTALDDHSRFAVCLQACADETTATVRDRLTATFRRHGLPERINVDNGSPWGHDAQAAHTPLSVWLLQLGVRVSHSRAYHPQTNGKAERFHRTLKQDVLRGRGFADFGACQAAFDGFLDLYNAQRPHEALNLDVPASRHTPSPRGYPEHLAPVEYDTADQVRRVQQGGWLSFHGHDARVPHAFAGHAVALRPTNDDGLWDVVFITHRVAQIDLRHPDPQPKPVTHVPEQV